MMSKVAPQLPGAQEDDNDKRSASELDNIPLRQYSHGPTGKDYHIASFQSYL